MAQVQAKQALTVDIDSLVPNPWNTNVMSPENEAKLRTSMTKLGFYKRILVRELPNGKYEILGGEHRWLMGKQMGYNQVPIENLGIVDEKTAKEIGLSDNGRYGNDDTYALSELLKELGKENVASFMPYSDAEIQSIVDISSIALDDLELTDDAANPAPVELPAPASSQMMRFKVPVEDVAWITSLVEKCMKRENFTSEDSLTNAGNAFVHLMKIHK